MIGTMPQAKSAVVIANHDAIQSAMIKKPIADLSATISRMHFGEHRSLRDIARMLGVPYSRVQKQAKEEGIQVKARLQSVLDKYDGHGPNWVGGRTVFKPHRPGSSPYIYVFHPEHPNANRRGYVLEHRYVMATAIGRALHAFEIVHHVNGKTTDNRVENLEVRLRGGKHQPHGPLSVCPHCGADLLRQR